MPGPTSRWPGSRHTLVTFLSQARHRPPPVTMAAAGLLLAATLILRTAAAAPALDTEIELLDLWAGQNIDDTHFGLYSGRQPITIFTGFIFRVIWR